MTIHELRVSQEAERGESYPHFARVIREKNLDAGVAIGIAFGGQAEAILEQTSASELLGVDAYEATAAAAASNPTAAAAAAASSALNLTAEQFENLFWHVIGRLSRFGARYNHVRGNSAQAAQ